MGIRKELPEDCSEFESEKITIEGDYTYRSDNSTVLVHIDPEGIGRLQQQEAAKATRAANGFNNQYAMDKARKEAAAEAEKQERIERQQRELDRILLEDY